MSIITLIRRLASGAAVFALAALIAGCAKDPEVAKREFVRSGDQYAAKKQYREAVVEYRNAVQQDARYGEGRFKLAEAYEGLGDRQNAYREFIRAADLLPDDVAAQLRAAEVLLRARQYPEASARVEQVLAKDPKNVDAQVLLASAMVGLRKIDDAIAEMEEAIATAPDRSANHANLGTLQMVRGNRAQAEAAFKQAVATDDRSVPARLALANFYWASGQPDLVQAQLEAALAISPKDPVANRAMALYYVGRKQTAEAERYLKVVAEVTPKSVGRLALADFYMASGRTAEAKSALAAIPAGDEDAFARSRIRLASLEFTTGNRAAAQRLIDAILVSQPNNTEALIARARLEVAAGDQDKARAALQSAVQSDSHSAAAQFAMGQFLVGRGETDAAFTAFTEAVKLSPGMAQAEVELARLHANAGRTDASIQAAQAAIAVQPGNAQAHLLLAHGLIRKGDLTAAAQRLEALRAALPASAQVHVNLGELYLAKKDATAARSAFERALALEPANIGALAGLTELDMAGGRQNAALARLEHASKASSTDARLLVLAGGVHAQVRDFGAAERDARAAIAVEPGNLDAYALLGQVLVATGRVDAAILEFQRITEKHPKSVPHLTALAVLLEMQNRKADARAAYERVLAADPRAAVASNNLAWMYAEDGDNLDVALQLAQAAKGQLPDNPSVNDTLGWIYHKKGLNALAVPPLLQSIDKDPGKPAYHYHLGVVYAANGEVEKARESLSRAVSLAPDSADVQDAKKALAGLKS